MIYADWLEDHREPERAELIRAQCALSNPSGHSGASLESLRNRVEEFLANHQSEWELELPGFKPNNYTRCIFRRGFVTEMHCLASYFVDHGHALVQSAPVQDLWIRRARSKLKAIARHSALAAIRGLFIVASEYKREDISWLAASPHVENLRRLDLHSSVVNALSDAWHQIGSSMTCAVASSSHLAELRELDLSGCGIGDEGGIALARSPYLQKIEDLNLRWNPLSDSVREELEDRYGEKVQFFDRHLE